MIRVVIEESPTLYRILGLAAVEDVAQVFEATGRTFYRAELHNHYILYKAAISGWGAAAPNPNDPRPVFSPGQR